MFESNLARIDVFRELSDPEWNQHKLLAPTSLEEYNWFYSLLTSDHPDDRPRMAQPGEVTVARMPDADSTTDPGGLPPLKLRPRPIGPKFHGECR